MDALPFDEPESWATSTLLVARVSSAEATEFVSRWHYARGGAGNTINVGLYHGMRLVGVAAFGIPVSADAAASVLGEDNADHVLDLGRFVLVDEAPHNTESWFLSRALRHLKAHRPHTWAVTSFADSTEGHIGTIYQATNAIYAGATLARTQYCDQRGRVRSDRMDGTRLSLADAQQRGWQPARRLPKHRYVFLTPDNRAHRRQLLNLLRWSPQPYPKASGEVSSRGQALRSGS